MVIDTVIDIGGSKKVPLSPTKPRIVALNLHGEEMRQHQRLMEARHKINELNSNLGAAMASLESANRDIDRLNAEIAELKDALKAERERNEKLSKQAKKQQKPSAQDEQNGSDGE
jgi:chromosome segregation ATPase